MKRERGEAPVCFLPGELPAGRRLRTPQAGNRSAFFLRTMIFGLALYGSLFLFIDVFQLSIFEGWTIVIVSAYFAVVTVLMSLPNRWQRLWLLAPALITLGWGVYLWDELSQGLLRFLNQLYTLLGSATYLTLQAVRIKPAGLRLSAHQNSLAVWFLFFWVALAIGYAVVRRANALLLVLITLPFFWAPVGFRLPVLLPAFFALLTAYFSLYVYDLVFSNGSAGWRETKERVSQRRRVKIPLTLRRAETFLLIPLVVLVSAGSVLILPQEGYQRPKAMRELRQNVMDFNWQQFSTDAFFGVRFQGFGDGDLRNLGPLRYTGKTVLKVSATDGGFHYLRGFCGAELKGRKWESISGFKYRNASEGFPDIVPQRLFATLGTFQRGNQLGNPAGIFVRNVSMARPTVFLTSFLASEEGDMGPVRFEGDASAALEGGATGYGMSAYTVEPFGVSTFYGDGSSHDIRGLYLSMIQYGLYGGSVDGETVSEIGIDYRRFCEELEAYTEFVYDTYTSLPEATRSAAERICEEYRIRPSYRGTGLDVEETCERVRTLLNQQCAYKKDPKIIPANVDFTSYFIDESREGYCVHFATAATVLLRALGIPARYAEGFVVVPSDFENCDENGFASIADDRAHAWVEIYNPYLLEWTPLEVTPGFSSASGLVDPNAQPDRTSSSRPASSVAPSPSSESSEAPDSRPTSSRPSSVSSRPSGGAPDQQQTADFKKILPVVYLLLAVVLTGLLALALYRAAAVRKRRQLEQPDVNTAVRSGSRYLVAMLRFAGCGAPEHRDTPASYTAKAAARLPWLPAESVDAVLESSQKARFSNRPCTEEERTAMMELIDVLSGELERHLSAPRRFLFRCRFPFRSRGGQTRFSR